MADFKNLENDATFQFDLRVAKEFTRFVHENVEFLYQYFDSDLENVLHFVDGMLVKIFTNDGVNYPIPSNFTIFLEMFVADYFSDYIFAPETNQKEKEEAAKCLNEMLFLEFPEGFDFSGELEQDAAAAIGLRDEYKDLLQKFKIHEHCSDVPDVDIFADFIEDFLERWNENLHFSDKQNISFYEAGATGKPYFLNVSIKLKYKELKKFMNIWFNMESNNCTYYEPEDVARTLLYQAIEHYKFT